MFPAITYVSDEVLQALAYIFTALSGVASIALTIHKFGLSPWKRVLLIVGVIIFGLAVILVVIPAVTQSQGPGFVTQQEQETVNTLTKYVGGSNISSITQTPDGNLTTVAATGGVKRVSKVMYAVQTPDGNKAYVFSGAAFDTSIGGKQVNCQLLEAIEGRVIIVYGDQVDQIDLNGDQENAIFKVERLVVNL
tara:strand:- start:10028 stop:10606 length:579 start_codon:yes stop_codon:yes gene_type:complete